MHRNTQRAYQKYYKKGTPTWEPQGDLLATIDGPSLPPTTPYPTISNVNYVASYNWLEASTPTILVPGSPRLWSPPTNSRRLPEDSEPVYRDINAAHYPSHPCSPAVQSILLVQPTVHSQEIDIFACGNTLGNLLRAARGLEHTFRFNAELIGKTVFFVRKENSPTDVIEDLRGHGHTFPEAYSRWEEDVKGSASHQRVISYGIGGLRCMVRSESDGFYEELAREGRDPVANDNGASIKAGEMDSTTVVGPEHAPALASALTSPSVAPEPSGHARSGSLTILPAGRRIPQCAIFDLKTRIRNREIDMADILPRVWMNQTPNFLVAYHRYGLFKDIRKKDVRDEVKAWEERHAEEIGRFHALLQRLVEVVKGAGEGVGMEVRRIENGPLEVRKLVDGEWGALEGEVRERWARGGGEDGGENVAKNSS